jgi:hypothetical protein
LVSFWSELYLCKRKVDWDKAVTQFGGQININDEKQADTVLDSVSISDLIQNWM